MEVKDLKKQYEVKRIDKTLGEEYLVWNVKQSYKRYHDNLEDAKYTVEHDKKLWKKNKPLTLPNGIGVTTDSDLHTHDFEWVIRWRWISKWETLKEVD